MVLYDGIIYRLQRGGGISVLFNELISRLPKSEYSLVIPELKGWFERYRDPRAGDGFDVFHSTYYRLPRDHVGAVVTTVHDFTYERYFYGVQRWVHSWQKNRAIAGSDRIICVSESTKKDLLEFCGAKYESKIVVIANGVSADYRSIPDSPVCDQVLFVGARVGYKNFLATVQALSEFNDLQLVCVGGGGFTSDELRLLDAKIPGRYRHAGFLSNLELNEEYNKSLCLVYPSLYEGFGIPVLEAMRAGCPVVAVNSSSIPEVSGDAAYLLESGAVEEIRQGIGYFCVGQNRDDYIKRGFLQAERFSWDLTFDRTVAIYEDLLGRKLLEDV